MDRKQIAKQLFLEGYSCSQSVAAAFADLAGVSQEEMLKMSIAFGGGFLHSRNLCGALSGMGIVLGMIYGESDSAGKKRFLQRFEKLITEFESGNGNLNCGPLLDSVEKNLVNADLLSATQADYQKKPCLKYVLDCVDMIEKSL